MERFDFSLLQQRLLAFSLTQEPLFLAAEKFYVAELGPKPNFDVRGSAIFGYDADTDRSGRGPGERSAARPAYPRLR